MTSIRKAGTTTIEPGSKEAKQIEETHSFDAIAKKAKKRAKATSDKFENPADDQQDKQDGDSK